jgi:hypothetical protein
LDRPRERRYLNNPRSSKSSENYAESKAPASIIGPHLESPLQRGVLVTRAESPGDGLDRLPRLERLKTRRELRWHWFATALFVRRMPKQDVPAALEGYLD